MSRPTFPRLSCVAAGWCIAAGAAALTTGLAGCNIIGPIASRIAGEEKLKPVYKLPNEPTLVLVERFGAVGSNLSNDQMAQNIVGQFQEHNLAPMIPVATVANLRTGKPVEFSKMQIVEVGRTLGARQVLYVDVREMKVDTPPGSEMIKAKVAVLLKLVDVPTGKTLWPQDVPAYRIEEETDYVHRSQSTEEDVSSGLMQKVGFEIARLFYEHPREYDTDLKQATAQ